MAKTTGIKELKNYKQSIRRTINEFFKNINLLRNRKNDSTVSGKTKMIVTISSEEREAIECRLIVWSQFFYNFVVTKKNW